MSASGTIESIKRQMQNMKTAKEDAFDRAEKADIKVADERRQGNERQLDNAP